MGIPNQDEIAELAYALWEQEGRPSGRNVEHWLIAEQELKLRRLMVAEGDSASVADKGRQKTVRKPKTKAPVAKTACRSRTNDIQ